MKKVIATLTALTILAGTAAQAQNIEGAVKARQGVMGVLGINLGILGGMAKGAIPYDADAALAAANSVLGVAMIDPKPLFPEGSDEMDSATSRAKAEVWEGWDKFNSEWASLKTAAEAMVATAATGQEAIGPGLGGIGGSCKSCHEAFRGPRK